MFEKKGQIYPLLCCPRHYVSGSKIRFIITVATTEGKTDRFYPWTTEKWDRFNLPLFFYILFFFFFLGGGGGWLCETYDNIRKLIVQVYLMLTLQKWLNIYLVRIHGNLIIVSIITFLKWRLGGSPQIHLPIVAAALVTTKVVITKPLFFDVNYRISISLLKRWRLNWMFNKYKRIELIKILMKQN